jgi:hypothetical protein
MKADIKLCASTFNMVILLVFAVGQGNFLGTRALP